MSVLLPLLAGSCQGSATDGCKLAHVTDLRLTCTHHHTLTPAKVNGVQTNTMVMHYPPKPSPKVPE